MTDPADPVDLSAVHTRISDLQTERWIRTMALLVIGGPILFLVTLGFGIKSYVDGINRDKLIRQGIACLLADLDDHRHTNQFAHESLAKNHHFPEILQPDVIPLTKEEAARLKSQCQHFVKVTLGVGELGGRAEARKEKP